MRVMIVEDEPNIVESLHFLFRREGWQVSVALDGKAAIESLLREPPDALVLDIMLPPPGGFEILKRVRREPALSGLLVVVLTAKGQEKDRHAAFSLGADAFVTKPFSNRGLVQQLHELFARRAADSALRTKNQPENETQQRQDKDQDDPEHLGAR